MTQGIDAQLLRIVGLNAAPDGFLLSESDGDPTNPAQRLVRLRVNRVAGGPPTVNDDSTQGYARGSIWLDNAVDANDPGGVFVCRDPTPGAADWLEVGAVVQGATEASFLTSLARISPGELILGNAMNYQKTNASTGSGVVQYTRVYLQKGLTLDRLRSFVNSGANGNRALRMGLYDQTDPADSSLVPNNRVAQTNILQPATSPARVTGQLTNAPTGGSGTPVTFVVPASGFYWLAFITDSTSLSFLSTDIYPQDFLPVRRQTAAGTTLPASASGLTNPQSAVIYVAGMPPGFA